MKIALCLLAAASPLAFATPALAGPGDPLALSEDISLDLTTNARLRYETVDQASITNEADALTLRVRAGLQLDGWGFSMLAEGEANVALVDDFNDTLPRNGIEPFPVVADPETLELNRLQISYMKAGTGVTVGRQRIIHDNSRFVGNVGWRQNEQTFDAVRGQAKLGPVTLDASYAISQRTIFGSNSPNEHLDGDLVLLNAGIDTSVIKGKAFAYLLDFDTRPALSSQTYGILATGVLPLPGFAINLSVSIATQQDLGSNPVGYSAEYYSLEIGTTLAGFSIGAGYEELGSDGGVASFQTPLATLHAFNGWADLFLTTPAAGLRDYYARLGKTVDLPAIGRVTAALVYHKYDSDFGNRSYGSEWNASLGFKLGPVNLLAKYANYQSDTFGADTERLWLQAEIGF